MASPIYHAFFFEYKGQARELVTSAHITDPITNKEMDVTKVIWDTGATGSAIRTDVANSLGLVPTGQEYVTTANGTTIANTYVLHITLPNRVTIQGVNVSDGDLGPDTEMIIGMDIIGMGDFFVQNVRGCTHFSFVYPPFETKYDVIEKANAHNKGRQSK